MNRFIILSLIMAFNLCGFAQLKSYDLANSDNLRFIPSYMTKDGKCFLYSCGNGYIVYDDNFNIIKQYNSSNIINYQSREVKYSRLIDPDTKEFLSEWLVEYDQTQDNTTTEWDLQYYILIISEDNISSSDPYFLSQTLFDEDEDFEFLRCCYEEIPITTKTEDYINLHSTDNNSSKEPQYNSDEWWREYGAESCESKWDDERQKFVHKLTKTEKYGGLYQSGLEVVNMDGVVEQTLTGINKFIYYAYHVNGDFYIKGFNDNKIYRLNSHKLPESNVYRVNYDLNHDGKVNVADHVKLSEIILNQK